MAFRKSCFYVVLVTLISGILFAQTTIASDFGAAVWARYFKDVIVKAAAQTAFKSLSNKIVQKIQTGGLDGKAAFVQNWINFTTNAQYQGEGIFRGELTNAKLCDYFSNSIKSTFGVKPTDSINIAGQNVRTDALETYALKTKCTLPSNFDINAYQKDFSKNGGWQAFSRLLEPQNNYYGVLFASLDEVAKQRALAQASAVNKAVSGGGFTGLLAGQNGCTLRGSGNKCLIEGNIKTPGSTLGQSAVDATSKGTTALLAGADGASIAVSALTSWAIDKLFDLGGGPSSPDGSSAASEDVNITSEQRTAESYVQEFCTAEDNISQEAGLYVKGKFPQAWKDYPVSDQDCGGGDSLPGLPGGRHEGCGKSYCEKIRDQYGSENSYPYSRCSQACLKAVGESKSLAAPATPPPPPPGEEGVAPPADALEKHPDQSATVAKAKSDLESRGVSLSGSCGAFEIVKEVVSRIDDGAGFLDKPAGNNCQGFAVDIIAYPDGYIYDVLGDAGGANNPQWIPDGCGPVGGGGTCPERYRAP